MNQRRTKVLEHIVKEDGSYGYKIAKTLGENRSTVKKILEAFEEHGFITVDESRQDRLRNKKWYDALKRGREFINVYDKYREIASKQDLSDDERLQLGSVLRDELAEENFNRAVKAGLVEIDEYRIGKKKLIYFKGFGSIIFDNNKRRILRPLDE